MEASVPTTPTASAPPGGASKVPDPDLVPAATSAWIIATFFARISGRCTKPHGPDLLSQLPELLFLAVSAYFGSGPARRTGPAHLRRGAPKMVALCPAKFRRGTRTCQTSWRSFHMAATGCHGTSSNGTSAKG